MKKNAGFTLVELMIAAFVSALLITSVYRLLSAGGRVFTKVQTHADLQTAGLVALSRLTAELRTASWRSVCVRAADATGPVAISFATPGRFSGLFTVYYLDRAAGRLYRGEAAWRGGVRLNATSLAQVVTAGLNNRIVMADHVVAFDITPSHFPATVPQEGAVQAVLRLSVPQMQTSTDEEISMVTCPRN